MADSTRDTSTCLAYVVKGAHVVDEDGECLVCDQVPAVKATRQEEVVDVITESLYWATNIAAEFIYRRAAEFIYDDLYRRNMLRDDHQRVPVATSKHHGQETSDD